MPLKGTLILRIRDALVASFTLDDFDDLLIELDKELESITTASGKDKMVKDVVLKAAKDRWIGDLIALAFKKRQDVAQIKALCDEVCEQNVSAPRAVENPYQAWRLLGGQYFVDRYPLRQTIENELSNELGKRILIVDGPHLSGKSHSLTFINHLQDSLKTFDIVWIDLAEMEDEQRVQPEDVGQSIVMQMGLEGMLPRQNEQDSTWGRHFCEWLSTKVPLLEQTYWIVIDHCDRETLPQGTRDLILHLTRFIPIKLKPYRLVLLGYPDWQALPLSVRKYTTRETLEMIDDVELIRFFGMLYQERQRQHNRSFTEDDITRAVADVLNRRKAAADARQMRELYWEALQHQINQVLQGRHDEEAHR